MQSPIEKSSPLRALIAWILFFFFIYILIRRYELSPSFELVLSEGFASGLYSRFWQNYFYGSMVAVLFGCLVYSLLLNYSLNTKNKRIQRALLLLVGVNTVSEFDIRKYVKDGWFDLSLSPLTDTAAMFPGIGFLGTVIGISIAIGGLEEVMSGQEPTVLISGLRTAFDTTFIGLVASLVLSVFNMSIIQSANKHAL